MTRLTKIVISLVAVALAVTVGQIRLERVQAALPSTYADRIFNAFTTDSNGNVALNIVSSVSGAGTLPATMADRWYNVFTTDSNGNVALNVVGAGGNLGATYLLFNNTGATGLTGYRTLAGTANQITLTDAGATSTLTLALPQSIATTSTPQFARLGLGAPADASGLLTLQGTNPGPSLALTGTAGSYALLKQQGAGSTVPFYMYNVNDVTGLITNREPNLGAFADTSKTAQSIILQSLSGDGYISFNTATSNNTSPSERVRIDKSGNVGIGTTNPSTPLHVVGTITATAGAGAGTTTNIGVASIQTSAAGVGNGADATDDTLFTYSLPLNSLSANGKSVRVRAWGKTAANANGKTIKPWFAGTAVLTSGSIAISNLDWSCEMEITRIDATHVSVIATYEDGGFANGVTTVTANLLVADLTANASIIKVTGASAASAANDVLGHGMKVWFEN